MLYFVLFFLYMLRLKFPNALYSKWLLLQKVTSFLLSLKIITVLYLGQKDIISKEMTTETAEGYHFHNFPLIIAGKDI